MHVVVDEGLPGSEPPGRPFGFSGEREGFGGGFFVERRERCVERRRGDGGDHAVEDADGAAGRGRRGLRA
jgi:hypothetical protein